MTRKTNKQEAKREHLENAMGSRARAKRLIEIVSIRAQFAQHQLPGLMEPAVKDIEEVKEKIVNAQKELSKFHHEGLWQE